MVNKLLKTSLVVDNCEYNVQRLFKSLVEIEIFRSNMHLLQAENPNIKDEFVDTINYGMNVEKETNRPHAKMAKLVLLFCSYSK